MISKVAIQAGLGVTAVGGIAGAVTYALWNDSAEYLVEVQTNASNTTDITDINTSEKNYFCQWEKVGTEKTDNDCLIKKIKFDDTKKSALLSKVVEEFNKIPPPANFESIEAPTKENLKASNNWFILKVKGYVFDNEATEIKIAVKTKDSTKQYTAVKPIVKISDSKAMQGKTKTFLTKLESQPSSDVGTISTSAKYKCIFEGETSDSNKKECFVYKFTTPRTEIKELNFGIVGKISASTDLKTVDQEHYIIIYTSEEQLIENVLSKKIIIVEDSGTKQIGTFSIVNALLGKKDSDSAFSNITILN